VIRCLDFLSDRRDVSFLEGNSLSVHFFEFRNEQGRTSPRVSSWVVSLSFLPGAPVLRLAFGRLLQHYFNADSDLFF